MTDEPAAPAAAKKKPEVRDMILAVQSEADRYRGWSACVSDGNRAGLEHRAAVLDAAATLVANAELAIAFVRANPIAFRRWRDGR